MTLGTLASSVFHSSVFHLPLWGGAGTCDGRWMFGAQAFGCWTFGAQLFGCWSFGAQALLWGLSVQSVEDLCSAITCWTLEMTFSSSSPWFRHIFSASMKTLASLACLGGTGASGGFWPFEERVPLLVRSLSGKLLRLLRDLQPFLSQAGLVSCLPCHPEVHAQHFKPRRISWVTHGRRLAVV